MMTYCNLPGLERVVSDPSALSSVSFALLLKHFDIYNERPPMVSLTDCGICFLFLTREYSYDAPYILNCERTNDSGLTTDKSNQASPDQLAASRGCSLGQR